MPKSIIITGVNGQLGQFLVKYLQENQPDVKIIGTVRHKSYDKQEYIFDSSTITWELMDLSDVHSIDNLIIKYKPDYFVNTSANAFVGDSWKIPVQHLEQNCIGVLHQLEAIRKHSPNTRYFNMGTSEEFGNNVNDGKLQGEDTKIDPKSPYGASKAAARYLISIYRKSYNLYAIQNWTFNFESELRGEKYVTKKVTQGVARIKKALDNNLPFEPIELGNLDSVRSWQFCGDVADSIWRSLNQDIYNEEIKKHKDNDLNNGISHPTIFDVPYIKEYVVSSTESHTIRELVEEAFKCARIDGYWTYKPDDRNISEQFQLLNSIKVLVKINPKYFRPLDVTFLNGDSSLIQKELGWKPTLTFKELIKRMVDWDLKHS